jgi:hypothetical protein
MEPEMPARDPGNASPFSGDWFYGVFGQRYSHLWSIQKSTSTAWHDIEYISFIFVFTVKTNYFLRLLFKNTYGL